MLLGGEPLRKRYIYWNFVSSSKDKIEQAKLDWANGPSSDLNHRFQKVLNDKEYIPLPNDTKNNNPKGTIM